MANNDFPQATFEAYMILLFEIARRLVALDDPSDKKVQYDVLPIGSAIARIVKLLELGRTDICTLEDVFFSTRKFHCFTGKPKDRKKAIDNINETTLATNGEGVPKQDSKDLEQGLNKCFEELKEMFCSGELLKEVEALSVSESHSVLLKTNESAINSELYSAFDYTSSDEES